MNGALYRLVLLFLITRVCLCLYMGMCKCVQCLQRQSEGVGSPGAGIACGCEPPGVGTGNWTPVLCVSSQHSSAWSHLTIHTSCWVLQYPLHYFRFRFGILTLNLLHKTLVPFPVPHSWVIRLHRADGCSYLKPASSWSHQLSPWFQVCGWQPSMHNLSSRVMKTRSWYKTCQSSVL